MTPREALNHFEEHLCKHCCEWDKSLRHCDSCPTDTAKKALEKQIPKKPTNNSWTHYHCPVCMKSVNSKYCGNCGQAIDWREEK